MANILQLIPTDDYEAVYVDDSGNDPFLVTAPVVALALVTLHRGQGQWTGSGWSWLLGTIGFAIPAVGLSLYLHYGYANDLNGMYSEAIFPQELFRYLPFYTMFAGATGFAIGWIVGRNARAGA